MYNFKTKLNRPKFQSVGSENRTWDLQIPSLMLFTPMQLTGNRGYIETECSVRETRRGEVEIRERRSVVGREGGMERRRDRTWWQREREGWIENARWRYKERGGGTNKGQWGEIDLMRETLKINNYCEVQTWLFWCIQSSCHKSLQADMLWARTTFLC